MILKRLLILLSAIAFITSPLHARKTFWDLSATEVDELNTYLDESGQHRLSDIISNINDLLQRKVIVNQANVSDELLNLCKELFPNQLFYRQPFLEAEMLKDLNLRNIQALVLARNVWLTEQFNISECITEIIRLFSNKFVYASDDCHTIQGRKNTIFVWLKLAECLQNLETLREWLQDRKTNLSDAIGCFNRIIDSLQGTFLYDPFLENFKIDQTTNNSPFSPAPLNNLILLQAHCTSLFNFISIEDDFEKAQIKQNTYLENATFSKQATSWKKEYRFSSDERLDLCTIGKSIDSELEALKSGSKTNREKIEYLENMRKAFLERYDLKSTIPVVTEKDQQATAEKISTVTVKHPLKRTETYKTDDVVVRDELIERQILRVSNEDDFYRYLPFKEELTQNIAQQREKTVQEAELEYIQLREELKNYANYFCLEELVKQIHANDDDDGRNFIIKMEFLKTAIQTEFEEMTLEEIVVKKQDVKTLDACSATLRELTIERLKRRDDAIKQGKFVETAPAFAPSEKQQINYNGAEDYNSITLANTKPGVRIDTNEFGVTRLETDSWMPRIQDIGNRSNIVIDPKTKQPKLDQYKNTIPLTTTKAEWFSGFKAWLRLMRNNYADVYENEIKVENFPAPKANQPKTSKEEVVE